MCLRTRKVPSSKRPHIKPSIAGFTYKEISMHNVVPLSLAVLVSVGIIVIGCFYVVSPQRISGGFGLKAPASDSDTSAWLRLKGIRDIASGLAVLTLMLTTGSRTVGIVLLVLLHYPFWRHVQHSGVWRQKGHSVLRSWRNLRGHALRRPFADPCLLSGDG